MHSNGLGRRVEIEADYVSRLADLDGTDIVSTKYFGTSNCRDLETPHIRKQRPTMLYTLEEHRLAGFAQHVGTVVACRTVNTETYSRSSTHQCRYWGDTAPEAHIARWAMSDTSAGRTDEVDLAVGEHNTVRPPDVVTHPTKILCVSHRLTAESLETEVLLVPSLGKMSVHGYPVVTGE